MSLSGTEDDPEWRMAGLDWDPEAMTASRRKGGGSGAKPRASPGTAIGRTANTSCQVEGCCTQLPLRSYYQRQHICEEHFRALAITDASGCVSRFCQQCTKLEPLASFDGQRRSCRASLERRNQRRAGRRRGSGGSYRARAPKNAAATPAAAAPAASPAPAPAGDGSPTGTAAAGSRNPRSSAAASGSASGGSSTHVLRHGSPSAATGTWQGASGTPASEARGRTERASSRPSGYWVEPLSPTGGGAAGAGAASATGGPLPAAGGACLTGMGPLDALSPFDVDSLLAMDADKLADVLLAGGVEPPLPPQLGSGNLGGLASQEWALPHLAPEQQLNVWPVRPAAAHAQAAAQSKTVFATGSAAQQALLRQQAALEQQHWLEQAALAQRQQQERAAAAAAAGLPPLQLPVPQPAQAPLRVPPALCPPSAVAGPEQPPWLQQAAATGSLATGPRPGGEGAELDALLGGLEPNLDEVRVSLKLYGAHPDQLPVQLRAELFSALALPPTAAQAALRSGCVHLTLTALVSREEAQRLGEGGAAAAALARLLPLAWSLPGRVALQAGDGSLALLARPSGDRPAVLLSLPQAAIAAAVPPAVGLASPLATTVSAAGGCFSLECPAAALAGGGRMALHCRCAGTGHLSVSLTQAGQAPLPPPSDSEGEGSSSDGASSSDEEEGEAADPGAFVAVEAWVPAAAVSAAAESGAAGGWQQGWGLYEFELSRGALLGGATPVLVLPDCHAAAAAELAGMHPSPRAACVLRLVAAVLRYLQQREGATGAAAAGFEARYPSVAVARLAAAARQLAALAQSAGWPALAALVAPAAIADGGHPARAALEVVGPPPAHQAQPEPAGAAQATASQAAPPLARDAGSPHKPSGGASGSGGGKLGCASSGAGAAAEAIPELAEDDCLRRVMTPRVLGAATLLAAGAVLGVGWALVSGHLG